LLETALTVNAILFVQADTVKSRSTVHAKGPVALEERRVAEGAISPTGKSRPCRQFGAGPPHCRADRPPLFGPHGQL